MHLSLSGRDHPRHLNKQRPCLLLIKAPSEFPQLILVIMTIAIAQLILRVKFHFTSVIFVLLFNMTANGRNLLVPKSYDLRPRLPPRDFHEEVIRNKIPPKIRCLPITEPAATPNQLTWSQKRDAILDSCQRTQTLQSKSVTQKDPNVDDKYTHFRHSAQSTPPGYSERQKEVKKRYSLKSSQKRLSIKNDVNAVIESSVHPKFCFHSQIFSQLLHA